MIKKLKINKLITKTRKPPRKMITKKKMITRRRIPRTLITKIKVKIRRPTKRLRNKNAKPKRSSRNLKLS
jgi:hypothetical protein